MWSAAFGRLCVETPVHVSRDLDDLSAAFGRLCVETFLSLKAIIAPPTQPPSGGCVLKPAGLRNEPEAAPSAAFGRLCVETSRWTTNTARWCQPPSGGCVLKHLIERGKPPEQAQPPSGGCVLKLLW